MKARSPVFRKPTKDGHRIDRPVLFLFQVSGTLFAETRGRRAAREIAAKVHTSAVKSSSRTRVTSGAIEEFSHTLVRAPRDRDEI